jgi:hypothetical protein
MAQGCYHKNTPKGVEPASFCRWTQCGQTSLRWLDSLLWTHTWCCQGHPRASRSSLTYPGNCWALRFVEIFWLLSVCLSVWNPHFNSFTWKLKPVFSCNVTRELVLPQKEQKIINIFKLDLDFFISLPERKKLG